MKDRQDYRYVARRARRYDESYLTRNFKGKAPFIIRYQVPGTTTLRNYLWVENIPGTRSKDVVIYESDYISGRTRHYKGSAIYNACRAAINRLLKEEDEQGITFTAFDYDAPTKAKAPLPPEFIKR